MNITKEADENGQDQINLNKCMPSHKCFQLNFIAIHFLENFSLHKKTIMGVYVKKSYICDWNVKKKKVVTKRNSKIVKDYFPIKKGLYKR